MPKAKYYAVRSGRQTGVYESWNDCKAQVDKYSGTEFKSFSSKAEADAYMGGSGSGGSGSGGSGRGSGSGSGGGSGYGRGSGRGYARSGASSRAADYSPYGSTSSVSGSASVSSRAAAPSRAAPSRAAPSRSAASSRAPSRTPRPVQAVYTDGSCIGNGKRSARAGWGAYWGDSRDAYGPVKHATNNAGELTAIKEALKEIKRNPGDSDYKIYSDSHYSLQAVGKWADKWEKQGWRTSTGEAVKNRELIQEVRTLMKDCDTSGVKVELEKVKGHANIPGNEAADLLARRGAGAA